MENKKLNYIQNKEKIQNNNMVKLNKLEDKLNKLSDHEVVEKLKAKNLPVYGTKAEKLDRLKKANNIGTTGNQQKNNKGNVLSEIEKIKQKREERRAENNKIVI